MPTSAAAAPSTRVFREVAKRSAELLCAHVAVLDPFGRVLARGAPAGRASGPATETAPALRIPLTLDGAECEIAVGAPVNGECVPARVAQALVDLVANQVVSLERLPNQAELKNKFIHDLLLGPNTDEAALLREAQVLGLDLTPARAVILIDAGAYVLPPPSVRVEEASAYVRRRAQFVIASVVSFFDLPNDTIVAYIGGGEVAVLKASTTQDLVAWTDAAAGAPASPSWANLDALERAAKALLLRLRRDTDADVTVGIGRYHPGLAGLARSYADARAALSLGRRVHGRNGVHCLNRLGIAAFVGVADEQTKYDLAAHLLSPLDHAPELLDTVARFLADDCCVSSTATRLAIHRNTLGYRLDKIASLTGLDPRRFDEAVQIRLALLLRALRTPALERSDRG